MHKRNEVMTYYFCVYCEAWTTYGWWVNIISIDPNTFLFKIYEEAALRDTQ